MSNSLQPLLPEPCCIHNTLALPCIAEQAVQFTHVSQLQEISVLSKAYPMIRAVGSGSNLILPDLLDGLTVLVRNKGITWVGDADGYRYIDVAAGEIWHEWVRHSLERGWYGLENLALIPGTVGAAPVQNIGAYGVELAQVIDRVRYWDLSSATMKELTRQACEFAYRDSIFKHALASALIVSVRFRLPLQWAPVLTYPDLRSLDSQRLTPEQIFEKVVAVRRQKLPDPQLIPNAGSFFKNPVISAQSYQTLRARFADVVAYPQSDGQFKLAAGWLIDQCGWKGRQVGPVRIHERQALVLTNVGQARANDVLQVAQMIKNDVAQRFGVELHIEPPCWSGTATERSS